MSEIIDKQHKFMVMVSKLIAHADSLGYQITGGDLYRDLRCRYGHAKSLHRMRLAIDINLFIDGDYQVDGLGHEPLGRYWESLGGSWGNDFGDPNHYSLEHGGMR
jgi:hypothetical protein